MSKRKRRRFTPDEKAAILRRHLADKVPVADLCDEYKLQPSVFYQWQRQLLDHAAKALEPQRGAATREKKLEDQVDALQQRLRRKDSVIAEISEEFVKVIRRSWGALNGRWVPHDLRDQVVDFVTRWSETTELPIRFFLEILALSPSQLYRWKQRYGLVNEHNGKVPRDFWLEEASPPGCHPFLRARPERLTSGYSRGDT